MWQRLSLVVVGLSVSACAAATTSQPPMMLGGGRDVLTAAEIVASKVTDVYQAIVQLRPEFLRRRNGNFSLTIVPPNPTVYVDELPYGGLDALRTVPLDRVRLIRYIPPQEADLRWGGTHTAGAILISTLR